MAFSYQESDAHERYDRGRSLTSDATHSLMELLRCHVAQPVSLVVDLGCGTGRFTQALADTFPAPVIGVEPAANMRAIAEGKPHALTIRYVEGQADRIPLEVHAADLVFISQVLHHLADRQAALREIHRVLKPEGRLCIRQTTRENLDSYFYQRFFPEARAVDERRLPSRAEMLRLAGSGSFRIVARETLRHQIAQTSSEYVEKIALRTYSDLECISDEAFRAGLHALREYCAAHLDHSKLAENDLFIFAKEARVGADA